ncbi:MAG: hypothetical protein LUF87_01900 [Alistipes sp.]|nr:hypothetical protein [Alistipes sp.]
MKNISPKTKTFCVIISIGSDIHEIIRTTNYQLAKAKYNEELVSIKKTYTALSELGYEPSDDEFNKKSVYCEIVEAQFDDDDEFVGYQSIDDGQSEYYWTE